MSRAEEILNKRRQELQKAKEEEKRRKEEEKRAFKEKVEETYNWILDLFENPSEFNTPYEVVISNTIYGNIQLGNDYQDGFIEKSFDEDVLEEVGNILTKDGFKVRFTHGTFPESFSEMTIEIK